MHSVQEKHDSIHVRWSLSCGLDAVAHTHQEIWKQTQTQAPKPWAIINENACRVKKHLVVDQYQAVRFDRN